MVEMVIGDAYWGLIEQKKAGFQWDSAVFSIPYNIGAAYDVYNDKVSVDDYLGYQSLMASILRQTARENAVIWLQMGPNMQDPGLPFEVLGRYFAQGWQLFNQICWIKSGTFPQKDGSEASFGHYRPMNSHVYLHRSWEWVFMLAQKNVTLDKLALGVDYEDKCLSRATRMLVRLDHKHIVVRSLASCLGLFRQGVTVEVPSYDFELKKPKWTKIVEMGDPVLQECKEMKLRNGARVVGSLKHKFPIVKINQKKNAEVLTSTTLLDIEKRQQAWKSARVRVYTSDDLSSLLPASDARYTYADGYAVGLFLAEGSKSKQNSKTVWFAAHQKESEILSFGSFLDDYFGQWSCPVSRYFSKNSKGMSFRVACAPFRGLLDHFVLGKGSHGKHLHLDHCLAAGSDFMKAVVDGFLEGDGSYRKDADLHYVGICNNKKLIKALRFLCLMCGYEFRQNATRKITDPKSFGAGKSTRANFWIRKTLESPHKRRLPRDNGLILQGLESIESVRHKHNSEVFTIDLQIEEPHSLFFLADGTMTHNSNIKRFKTGSGKRCRGNVWVIPMETTQKSSHPCPFPRKLVRNCLELQGLKPGSTVLDPYMGTGATAEVAHSMGMDFLGFDLSETYINEAKKRPLGDKVRVRHL